MIDEVRRPSRSNKPAFNRVYLFPVSIFLIYAVLYFISPYTVFVALISSGKVFLSMLVPLLFIFVLMFLINLFVKPAQVAKLLGQASGIKGTLLVAAAGILSTGPIYAWYPLLRDLKEKGAGNYAISVFLYNRAVKPFLLPIMVDYFGWLYVIVLTILTVATSIFVGYSINSIVTPDGE